jgi:IS5 family transposase
MRGRPNRRDRLCDEGHLNLAYRWFCGFDLDREVPDHSTFLTVPQHLRATSVPS